MTSYALFNDNGDCTAIVGTKAVHHDGAPVPDHAAAADLWRGPDGKVFDRVDYTALPPSVPIGFVWETLGVEDSRAFVDHQAVVFPFVFEQPGLSIVEVKGRYRLLSFVQVTSYVEQRAAAYPPITDQLDQIYHQGLDAWRATIASVKDQFPKVSSAGE